MNETLIYRHVFLLKLFNVQVFVIYDEKWVFSVLQMSFNPLIVLCTTLENSLYVVCIGVMELTTQLHIPFYCKLAELLRVKCIFLDENVCISIKISLKIVPEGPVNNISALVQIMGWRRLGDKQLSEPTMVDLLTHICVIQPQ